MTRDPRLPGMPAENVRKPALTDAAFGFLTGQRAASPTGAGGLRGLLTAAFGPSRRDPNRPDLTAASKTLGVSPRQLRRWVAGDVRRPNPAAVAQLRKVARQAASTQRGRRRAMQGARQTGAARRPARKNALRVSGVQGVTSSNEDQYRDRSTSVELSDQHYADMQNAWADRGNAGLVDWLHDHWDANYQTGWHFVDIDQIDWDNR